MSFSKILSSVALCFALNFSVHAEGREGGGGEVIIQDDNSVVLADPFLDHDAAQPTGTLEVRKRLNPYLVRELKQMTELLLTYIDPLLNKTLYKSSELADQVKLFIQKDGVRDLEFVALQDAEELKAACDSHGIKIYRPKAAKKVSPAGCTAGKVTFFIEPLVRRMVLRQQALFFIHERLTPLITDYDERLYSPIAKVTTGLNIVRELQIKQSQGATPPLSAEEHEGLNSMLAGVIALEYRNVAPNNEEVFEWRAFSNGGGLALEPSGIHTNAFLDVYSRVKNSEISSGARIEKSVVLDSKVGPSSRVLSSNLRNIRLNNSTLISKSNVDCTDTCSIGSNSSISNLKIGQNPVQIQIGDRVTIEGLFLIFNREIKSVEVGNDSSLMDVQLTSNNGIYKRVGKSSIPNKWPPLFQFFYSMKIQFGSNTQLQNFWLDNSWETRSGADYYNATGRESLGELNWSFVPGFRSTGRFVCKNDKSHSEISDLSKICKIQK